MLFSTSKSTPFRGEYATVAPANSRQTGILHIERSLKKSYELIVSIAGMFYLFTPV
ncbi:hypothetical protein [Planctopirus hydrillae]|uniref:hypothetical protein n=1 Tax=Planctopirus hydrillae TaxID=1841610 RepID=UPI0013F4DBCE|nr:hypothetical protein [Planctopirus hydrillae]